MGNRLPPWANSASYPRRDGKRVAAKRGPVTSANNIGRGVSPPTELNFVTAVPINRNTAISSSPQLLYDRPDILGEVSASRDLCIFSMYEFSQNITTCIKVASIVEPLDFSGSLYQLCFCVTYYVTLLMQMKMFCSVLRSVIIHSTTIVDLSLNIYSTKVSFA